MSCSAWDGYGRCGSRPHFIIPLVDVLRKVSLRTVTMPIQSQGIITKDNVSIDVAGVAYFHVTDAEKSVVEIEDVPAADQPDSPDHVA